MEEKVSEEKLYKCKQWLHQKYEKEELSIRKIARLCDVDAKTIFNYLKKFQIERRKGWAPETFFIGVRVSGHVFEMFTKYCTKKKTNKAVALRGVLIEHLMKQGFNPYKEN